MNGREQWLGLSVSRLSDQKHDLFVFRDITEEKERFKELEQRLQEAEDASKYKTTFLSKMSHEIRTPMNGIIGMMALAPVSYTHLDVYKRQLSLWDRNKRETGMPVQSR